jgi:hypothetical protein
VAMAEAVITMYAYVETGAYIWENVTLHVSEPK